MFTIWNLPFDTKVETLSFQKKKKKLRLCKIVVNGFISYWLNAYISFYKFVWRKASIIESFDILLQKIQYE